MIRIPLSASRPCDPLARPSPVRWPAWRSIEISLSALWAGALWRAAVPCVAVTILLMTLSFTMVSNETATVSSEDDISQQFELALLAPADQLEEVQ